MTRRLLYIFTTAAVAALAPVAAADAAKKPAPYPSVTSISPLNVGIGDTMTITGKNFIAGKQRNTVVFKRDGKRAIFVKAAEATKTSLKVAIPEKLRPLLGKRSGAIVPTKFRIRVLSRRFAKSYTSLKASPTIAGQPKTEAGKLAAEGVKELAAAPGPAPAAAAANPQGPPPPPDCDRDGMLDNVDGDDDNDLLSDGVESGIGTDKCKADTDGDGMTDAWEYKSAFDLNQRSCPNVEYPVPCAAAYPYPGQKPYPNPLDGKDGHLDHDGDWLSASQEYTATVRHGSIDITNLWYSGGMKSSQDTTGDGCRGMSVPLPFNGVGTRPEFRRADGTYPDMARPEFAVYKLDNMEENADGCLNDAERDEDGDFLNNFNEAHNSLSEAQWWKDVFEEPLYQVVFEGTDWLDEDSDGDTVVDGLDDQDHDDFLNVEEQAYLRGWGVTDAPMIIRTGLWVDPFNPCVPSVDSRTCPDAIPVKGDVWMPFYRESLPEKRWPLYSSTVPAHWWDPPYNPAHPPVGDPNGDTTPPEIWDGLPIAQQTLPPQHPLPRCFGVEVVNRYDTPPNSDC